MNAVVKDPLANSPLEDRGIDFEQVQDPELRAAIDAEKAAMDKQRAYERLQILGVSLGAKAQLQVVRRKMIEDRWFEDLQQFHGCYPQAVLASIRDVGGSEVFVNITRPKTETFSARLSDMLLPTDDVNWGIEPTPIPETLQGLGNNTPLQTPEGKQVVTPEGHPVNVDDMARGIIDAARNACDAMEQEMSDQLMECSYNAVQRDIIDDMAIYGTGILKGPAIVGNTRRIWAPVDAAKGIFKVTFVEEKRPAAMRVSPWDFFPDMSAVNLEDCEFIFERHFMTRRQVRALKDLPGFNKDALRSVLETAPSTINTSYMNRIRAIAGVQSITDERYEVWEYHGPVDKDDLIAAGVKIDMTDDPLLEYEGVIWLCNNIVIKAVINPLDTEERPYSVCYCSKDDTNIFGFGFPYLLRAAQAVACASWRMVLDNAGLSTGPQVVVDRRAIQPADGDHKLKPRKVWEFVGEGELKDAFKLFNIDGHTEELLKIFETAMRLGDDETNLPLIAQGNQAPHITKTAQGMSMLMNAANVVLRKAVRAYDDGITLTFVPRLYDWNMQFNPKPAIKGDFNVIAKGSSVLMEREQQTNSLIQALNLFNQKNLGVWIDDERFVKALTKNLRLDGVTRTKAEVDRILKDQAKQPQGRYKDSKEYLDKQLQLGADELRAKLEMHNQDTDTAMAQMAADAGTTEAELRTKLGIKRIDVDAMIKMFNAEMIKALHDGQGI